MSLPDSEIAARMARLARLDEARELDERSFALAQFVLMGGDTEEDYVPGSATGIKITPEGELYAQYGNRFKEVTDNSE
jgi:hypothetical protein